MAGHLFHTLILIAGVVTQCESSLSRYTCITSFILCVFAMPALFEYADKVVYPCPVLSRAVANVIKFYLILFATVIFSRYIHFL